MICLVTDRRRMPAGADALDQVVELVAAAARAGVHLIQVRERDLEARDLWTMVRRCVRAVEGTGAKVLVNDRADVALAAGAHGVHLRAESMSAARVRSILPASAIVGRSVHGAGEALTMAHEGAVDYLIFGTLFETASKGAGSPLATLDELAAICRGLRSGGTHGTPGVPVLAIGGMTPERAELAHRAGAAGIAGIGLFIPPAGRSHDEHLHTIVPALRRTFDTCGAVS